MPHYDYRCSNCGHKEEILQKMTEAPLTKCPQCKKEGFQRLFGTGIGLQFQGSGFYSTDYGSPKEPPSSNKEPSPPSAPGCGCGKPSFSS